MPDWLIGVIISGSTLIGTTIITSVIGIIIKRKFDKYFKKKDEAEEEDKKNREEAEKLKAEERQRKLEESIDKVVKEHTDPIDAELGRISDKLDKVAEGTLDTLRDRILTSYYKCLDKGYRTSYDTENVNHMYKDYLALNGNSYVEECVEKFKKIPTEEEWKIQKKKTGTKKKILNENK